LLDDNGAGRIGLWKRDKFARAGLSRRRPNRQARDKRGANPNLPDYAAKAYALLIHRRADRILKEPV
jgi:hypothetical protein